MKKLLTRRRFLKNAAMTAVAVSVPALPVTINPVVAKNATTEIDDIHDNMTRIIHEGMKKFKKTIEKPLYEAMAVGDYFSIEGDDSMYICIGESKDSKGRFNGYDIKRISS